MAHRHLLNERCAVFSEVPPLKHLPGEKKAPEISLGDTLPANSRDEECSQQVHPLANDQGWNLSPHRVTPMTWFGRSCHVGELKEQEREWTKPRKILVKCYVPPSPGH